MRNSENKMLQKKLMLEFSKGWFISSSLFSNFDLYGFFFKFKVYLYQVECEIVVKWRCQRKDSTCTINEYNLFFRRKFFFIIDLINEYSYFSFKNIYSNDVLIIIH